MCSGATGRAWCPRRREVAVRRFCRSRMAGVPPRGRGTGAKADGAPESMCGDELRSCPTGRCFSTCALGSPGSLRKHAGEVHKKSRELALIAFVSQSEGSDRRWASRRPSRELSGHILQASQACRTRLCYLPGLPVATGCSVSGLQSSCSLPVTVYVEVFIENSLYYVVTARITAFLRCLCSRPWSL